MNLKSFQTALAVFAATSANLISAKELRVGLISDLHLHLRYDPQYGSYKDKEGGCMFEDGTLQEKKAPMGRYTCDSPSILI